ncbi:glycosyltransferase family 25 protein [Pseudooceanicola algae]|uniref:Glycosyl transferase family 25 domain-containing protein n=1 Tax=Pseudooceanicola algae TaxID=1537215 RepID=A0A418SG28_9RHOB|nr:glycosyltransferase family 25 protein [Pseudooceanicola algae]QPM91632.1 hypothetical protein PSAL_028870 [Pseudooceanicola algae]
MVQSYVIHLDASTAREPLVKALARGLPDLHVVPAVNGRAMSHEAVAEIAGTALLKPRYPFPLMPSEIGCFLSHRAAWERIVGSRDPFGIVAEDDVVLGKDFATALALALEHASEDSLIRFPMSPRETPAKVVAEAGGHRLFRPEVIGLTAALYLLGRGAAERLLEASERFDRPVDTWLQMRWETGVDSLTIWPADISSGAATTGGSTIQRKKTPLSEITRSWKRSRYRRAIAKKSGTS